MRWQRSRGESGIVLADGPKTENQKILLQVSLDTIRDLSAEIRHCDTIALLFITINATICGSVIAGLLNIAFSSFLSTLGFFFLVVLFTFQVGVARGLQTRVQIASAELCLLEQLS